MRQLHTKTQSNARQSAKYYLYSRRLVGKGLRRALSGFRSLVDLLYCILE